MNILFRNGPNWWKIRREFQKGLSRPQNVRSYLEETDKVVKEFLRISVQGRHEDFLPLLSRLYLECNETTHRIIDFSNKSFIVIESIFQ